MIEVAEELVETVVGRQVLVAVAEMVLAELAGGRPLILSMLVVGLELTTGDFRRVLRYPRAVTVATLSQLLLLPACAALLVWIQAPEPWVLAGIVLLGRGNVALSVTLTAISTLLALGTMPGLTAAGLALFLQESHPVAAPMGPVVGQLALMMLLRLGLGIVPRDWRPARSLRRAGPCGP